jgi:hypothetical protein
VLPCDAFEEKAHRASLHESDHEAERAQRPRPRGVQRPPGAGNVAMGEETVRLKMRMARTDDIVEVEVSDRDAAAANKALELLGKTPELRLWVDQVETTVGHEFDNMSYDELKQWLIEEGRALGLIPSNAPQAPNGNGGKKH